MRADWGICLARSDPDVPKHEGITYFIVDMHTEGIEIRPLREITGAAMFNEVFFTDVFVPDDCVVGQVERRMALGPHHARQRAGVHGRRVPLGVRHRGDPGGHRGSPTGVRTPSSSTASGSLLAEAQSMALLGAADHAAVGVGCRARPRGERAQAPRRRARAAGAGIRAHAARGAGATTEGDAGRWSQGFLSARCLTIAGGTSEVQRNVIGERILGLPRDPEPGS